ncbi:DUF6552 family protein [Pelagimonas varians]|uniref:DUF6552 family protein n=1 Tax=Pelagimonas varians TaxID=696760 RepID=UPI000BEF1A5B
MWTWPSDPNRWPGSPDLRQQSLAGPWNLGILGLLGRLAVGLMWRDEALFLVQLVAFRAMVGGMLTR